MEPRSIKPPPFFNTQPAEISKFRNSTASLVEAREFPGLLVERSIEDEGPFYKLYPEGLIEHFDVHDSVDDAVRPA